VINLVGILKGDFQTYHVEGAANVAAAAVAAGAQALVQISAIGADPESLSAYGRSKAEGEATVRAAFAGATILRPSIVFGPEDNFVNKLARMAQLLPLLPVIKGDWRLQPVFAADLGRAIAAAALDSAAHGGKTYAIAGPNVTTMRELNRWVARAAGHPRGQFDVPDPIAKVMARVGGFFFGAPMTWDQWLMLQSDNVADPALPGLAAFGIRPTPLEAIAEEWLVAFKRHGRFAKAPSA
jgi:NADH dehydrogenase